MAITTKHSDVRAFFDANVLMESVESRASVTHADAALRLHRGNAYISALTVHLIMYFGLKSFSSDVLRAFLGDFSVLAVDSSDVEWAFEHMNGDDFEDALQLAVAVREGCTVFYTFDKSLYRTYGKLPYIQIKLLGARK